MAPKRKRTKGVRGDAFFQQEESGGEDDVLDIESSDDEAHRTSDNDESEGSEGDKETADEKRIRLAKDYLRHVAEDVKEAEGDGDLDADLIAHRLQKDLAEERGRFKRNVAQQLKNVEIGPSCSKAIKGHKLSVTCVALSEDDTFAASGSKDSTVAIWDIETQKKRFTMVGGKSYNNRDADPLDHDSKRKLPHFRDVLSVAISGDGKYVASGGFDNMIKIWDVRNGECVETFFSHRGPVSCLAFRVGSNQLFSGSHDRTVKIWDLDQLAYVDTLFGHHSEVTAINSLYRDRAVSTSRDRTVRVWKVVEETQLLFQPSPTSASADCVTLPDEETIVTGDQNGSLSLWHSSKKKAVMEVPNAHQGNWISSVGSLRQSDLFASGSNDGSVRLWSSSDGQIEALTSFKADGFVNGIQFAKNGRFVLCGIGQEHRMGRWGRVQKAKNGIQITSLPLQVS